jgi:hypothetical protein
MAGNSTHPEEIRFWKVEFDPAGYASSSTWHESIEAVEDILQLHLVIDVGFYGRSYVVLVVENQHWDEPIGRVETASRSELSDIVNELVTVYAVRKSDDSRGSKD